MVALSFVPPLFAPALYDDFTLVKQGGLIVAAALIVSGLFVGGFTLPASRAVRISLGVWVGLLVLSEFTAVDRRGSLLGLYQYRQGLLTQLCYLCLFLGGVRVGSGRRAPWAFLIAGAAVVAIYTAIQSAGADPVNWWTDTSARAIGTIGNANELAAFAMVSFAGCAAARIADRRSLWLCAGVAWAAAFMVFESESRSGLIALVLFFILLPIAWRLARNRMGTLLIPGLGLALGVALAFASSLAAGGLSATSSRVETGIETASLEGSTRFALWRGTLEVISSKPWLGSGADGLYLTFPVHRPADLSGAFQSYDLVVQSSHNAALDIAANYGIPALVAFAALVVSSSLAGVRGARARADVSVPSSAPFVWAALAAYGSLTMLNPISLAPQAIFFFGLGTIASARRVQVHWPLPSIRGPVRAAIASPAIAGAVTLTVLMVAGDFRANQAWEMYADDQFESAASSYGTAAKLMPLERHYEAEQPRALLAAGVDGASANLEKADEAFAELDREFGLTAGDVIGQATAQIGLNASASSVLRLIERARLLNPHGVSMAEYVERMKLAAVEGGVLHYSESDRWVYVTLRSSVDSPVIDVELPDLP